MTALAGKILTSQLSPDQVIANLSVESEPDLSLPDLELLIGRIEDELRATHPDLFKLFVRPAPANVQSRTANGAGSINRTHG